MYKYLLILLVGLTGCTIYKFNIDDAQLICKYNDGLISMTKGFHSKDITVRCYNGAVFNLADSETKEFLKKGEK